MPTALDTRRQRAKSWTSCTGTPALPEACAFMQFRDATERVDIQEGGPHPCRNIKHAFFQPADNEMITLVHFHLTNPIMVVSTAVTKLARP